VPCFRAGKVKAALPRVKARYVGVCRGCGAYTQPRNGKGDAYRYWISLPKPRESTAKSRNRTGGLTTTQPSDLQVFLSSTLDFAHNSGR
jgi:hypothetical protein